MEPLDDMSMSWSDLQTPQTVSDSPWFQVLPEREQKAIAYALLVAPTTNKIDVSQSIGRGSKKCNDLFPTLVEKSKVYLINENRLFLGYEALLMHGVSKKLLKPTLLSKAKLTDNQLRDLAGNSFLAGAVSAVLIAALLHAPPLSFKLLEEDDTEVEDDLGDPYESVVDMLNLA